MKGILCKFLGHDMLMKKAQPLTYACYNLIFHCERCDHKFTFYSYYPETKAECDYLYFGINKGMHNE